MNVHLNLAADSFHLLISDNDDVFKHADNDVSRRRNIQKWARGVKDINLLTQAESCFFLLSSSGPPMLDFEMYLKQTK